jgi:hypothetical protein
MRLKVNFRVLRVSLMAIAPALQHGPVGSSPAAPTPRSSLGETPGTSTSPTVTRSRTYAYALPAESAALPIRMRLDSCASRSCRPIRVFLHLFNALSRRVGAAFIFSTCHERTKMCGCARKMCACACAQRTCDKAGVRAEGKQNESGVYLT